MSVKRQGSFVAFRRPLVIALASLCSFAASTDPAPAQDPVAFFAISSEYREDVGSLGDLKSVLDPSFDLVEKLTLARYKVELWIGDDGTPNSRQVLDEVRVKVSAINEAVWKENDRRYSLDFDRPDSQKLPRLHILDPPRVFRRGGDLEKPFAAWLEANFGPRGSAPFGWVAVNGHGVHRYTPETTLHEECFLGPFDSVQSGGVRLSKMAYLAYEWSAPLILSADMCRTEARGDRPQWTSRAYWPDGRSPRGPYSEGDVSRAATELRAFATPLSWSLQERRRPWSMMFNGRQYRPIDDRIEFSLARAIATGLARSEENAARLRLKGLEIPSTVQRAESGEEANLHEVYEFAEATVVANSVDAVQPEFGKGPVERNMLIYSLRPTASYGESPRELDLLPGASIDGNLIGMTVRETPNGEFAFGRTVNGGVGWAKLRLGEEGVRIERAEIDFQAPKKWVRVGIEAVGPVGASCRFLIQPGGNGGSEFLTTRAGNEHSIAAGEYRYYTVPIDRATSGVGEIDRRFVEMDRLAIATPAGSLVTGAEASNLDAKWSPGVDLRLKYAKLVDAQKGIDLGYGGLAVASTTPPIRSLLNRWWCFQALRSSASMSIDRIISRNQGSVTHAFRVMTENAPPIGYEWGAEGPIDPPLAVEAGVHRLRVTVTNLDGQAGRVGLEVRGGGKTPLVEGFDLPTGEGKVSTTAFEFGESARIEAMAIVARGSRRLRIDSVIVETKPE